MERTFWFIRSDKINLPDSYLERFCARFASGGGCLPYVGKNSFPDSTNFSSGRRGGKTLFSSEGEKVPVKKNGSLCNKYVFFRCNTSRNFPEGNGKERMPEMGVWGKIWELLFERRKPPAEVPEEAETDEKGFLKTNYFRKFCGETVPENPTNAGDGNKGPKNQPENPS